MTTSGDMPSWMGEIHDTLPLNEELWIINNY